MKTRVQKLNGKKYLHVLDHENTTTAQFGFVQPLMVNERCAKDTVDLRSGQSIFLAPMSKPTFGKVDVKTYHSFVKCTDIWHPFESFLSGQTYSGSNLTYVPNQVPGIALSYFKQLLSFSAKVYVYQCDNYTVDSRGIQGIVNARSIDRNLQSTVMNIYRERFITAADFPFMDPDEVLEYSTLEFYWPEHNQSDPFEIPAFDFFVPLGDQAGHRFLCFGNYNSKGRNIRKVLLGCGYQLNNVIEEKTLLPLFAYYKAWFDLFMPARDMTWKETTAFSFMEWIEQNDGAAFNSWLQNHTARDRFYKFFFGLADCYYTKDPDYVSAHIVDASLKIATQGDNSISTLGPQGDSLNQVQVNSPGSQPQFSSLGANGFVTQNKLDVLRQLYYRINAATGIGGKIKAFLRSEYGNTEFEEPDSSFIGSQHVECNISLVESNAATDDAYLGQYAAIGRADNGGRNFHYECKTQGFVVSLMTVVPRTRYAQAVDPNLNHLYKYDYYTERFDSITLLPTPKYNVYGVQEVEVWDTEQKMSQGFGNIPNYMEYKTKYNILNGDMSLGSTREGYLPFTLNTLLPFRDDYIVSERTRQDIIKNLDPSLLVASSRWRYIGKEKWLGFFDRIFIESGKASSGLQYDKLEEMEDDQFIVYTYMDYKIRSFALPVSSSWQTGADGDSFEVQKA